jgi:hypothetical protein
MIMREKIMAKKNKIETLNHPGGRSSVIQWQKKKGDEKI